MDKLTTVFDNLLHFEHLHSGISDFRAPEIKWKKFIITLHEPQIRFQYQLHPQNHSS